MVLLALDLRYMVVDVSGNLGIMMSESPADDFQ